MEYRIYWDYQVFEDGTIINKYGKKLSRREHNGRYEIRLIVAGERKNLILSRLMYWMFVEQFDIENKNLCVICKDDNFLNIHPSNLQLVDRKDLIQGEGHRKRAKISDQQAEDIKAIYKGNAMYSNQFTKTGVSLKELAEQYGVTKKEIHHIVKGTARNPDNYILK